VQQSAHDRRRRGRREREQLGRVLGAVRVRVGGGWRRVVVVRLVVVVESSSSVIVVVVVVVVVTSTSSGDEWASAEKSARKHA
jgi:hypothetical protein